MARDFDPETSPYPKEVVAKLLEAKQTYEGVLAHRRAEGLLYDKFKGLCVELRQQGVGMRVLASIFGLHPTAIQRITKGWDSPETGT